jgi:peptidoglycan/LPS O-acetylase OafA/YrhL
VQAGSPTVTVRERAHMPQLDGLRAIAVLAVIVSHNGFTTLNKIVPLGRFGVQLFFVLSGFLITGILLDCRERVETKGAQNGMVLRRFYIRRALRIAPLYYVTIVVTWLLNIDNSRSLVWYNAFYLSNFYSVFQGTNQYISGHFWSLAVEEQFYLFWPIVILLTPSRWLFRVLIAAMVAGPLFRFGMAGLHLEYLARLLLLPGSLELLAGGAVLAYVHAYPSRFRNAQRWIDVVGVAGAALFALYCLAGVLDRQPAGVESLLLPTMFAAAFVALIDRTSRGFGGRLGAALEWGPLSYLGRVSYGLYILHPFVGYGIDRLFESAGWSPASPLLRFFTMMVCTTALANVSWVVVERPINNLKRKYPYFPPQATPTVPANPLAVAA